MNFFTHKKIDVTFTKGPKAGTFTESGTDTVKLSGLRVSATVIRAGGDYLGALEMRIWGLTLSKMNDLATLGYTLNANQELLHNTILVEAGDDETGTAIVFYGTIYAAWSDFMGMPDNPFHVMAQVGMWDKLKPVPPTSYRGLVDVATILSGLASLTGRTFTNNGVTAQVENPYYPGTAVEQINRICAHANIDHSLDHPAPLSLVIWPKGGVRDGAIPLISRDTGMVGYPTFTGDGLMVTCYFNAALAYGQKVKIQSDLAAANKEMVILTLAHTLEAEIPRGHWISRFTATEPQFARPTR